MHFCRTIVSPNNTFPISGINPNAMRSIDVIYIAQRSKAIRFIINYDFACKSIAELSLISCSFFIVSSWLWRHRGLLYVNCIKAIKRSIEIPILTHWRICGPWIHSKNERFFGDLKLVFQLVPYREPILGLWKTL